MKRISLLLTSMALVCSTVFAGQNTVTGPTHPASKEWVLEQLANFAPTSLTAQDWAAACDSGSPTSATGCYGNIASSGFAKLNKIIGGGGFTDQIDIPVASVPNSFFIQQFNGNSAIPSTTATSPEVKIPASSAPAMCAYFATNGANLSYEGLVLNDDCEAGGGIQDISNNNTFQTVYRVASACVVDAPVVTTYYVLCVGYHVTNTSTPPTPSSLSGLAAQ